MEDAMSTTLTQAQIDKLGASEWKHPRTGEVRYYLNGWTGMVGLEVSRYGTGNISSASLGGEHISNAQAGRLLGVKVWVDATGQVRASHPGRQSLADEMVALVAPVVAEVLDEVQDPAEVEAAEAARQARDEAEAEAERFARRRNASLILRTAAMPLFPELDQMPPVRRGGFYAELRQWVGAQDDPRGRAIALGMAPEDVDLMLEVV
jgi:hypothetical protein